MSLGVSCDDPPIVANAVHLVEGNSYGDKAVYTSQEGFAGSFGSATWNITCESTASWSRGLTCSSKGIFPQFVVY